MSLPEITDVQRLRLEPGDALVLHLAADRISAADALMVKERARAGLGLGDDVPLLVLAAGHRLSVVSAPGGDMSTGPSPACEGRAPGGGPVPPGREVG